MMYRHFVFSVVGIFLFINTNYTDPAFAGKNNIPDTHKKTITCSSTKNLMKAVSSARPGTTILLKNGVYKISSPLIFRYPDVWLRSESGIRDKVVLDGKAPGKNLKRKNCVNEIIFISASSVCIADITIRYARDHAIHIAPMRSKTIKYIRMHNLHIYDCGQQLIKVNSNGSKPLFWVDDSILENSLLEFIDSSIMQKTGNSYYTGGIDIHGGKNWRIRDNTFRNIQRKGKLMEHAVHLWSKSRDSIVERNRFINCYRGIGFGMKLRPEGHVRQYPDKKGNKPYFDHVGGVIRNNAIFNSRGIHLESGIELMNVIDVKVVHNTVVSVDKPFACIEYRWPNTRLSIYNNLVSHSILVRNNAKAKLGSNITHAPRGMFINYGKGNVHLSKNAKQAINQGKKYKGILVVDDLERKKRDMKPDIGAYEY